MYPNLCPLFLYIQNFWYSFLSSLQLASIDGRKKITGKAACICSTAYCTVNINYVEDKKDIDYNTVYSIHTIITILYNVFLFISWNFFASFVTSLISMVILTDIFNISLFPTVLKVAE
jgi:hypothetical protein